MKAMVNRWNSVSTIPTIAHLLQSPTHILPLPPSLHRFVCNQTYNGNGIVQQHSYPLLPTGHFASENEREIKKEIECVSGRASAYKYDTLIGIY